MSFTNLQSDSQPSAVNPSIKPIHIERNPLGDFAFYPDYVVAEWLKPEIDSFDLMKMETVASEVYGERCWGYISNRTHATVSNPNSVYELLQRRCAPKAVAIVTYSIRSRIVAQIEKEHCRSVPMEIFTKLDEAVAWMASQMRDFDYNAGSLELRSLCVEPVSA